MNYYAIIKADYKKNNIIKKSIVNQIEKAQIVYYDNIIFLIAENQTNFSFNLISLQQSLLTDYNIRTSIIIIPFFHEIFFTYFQYAENNCLTLFELLAQNQSVLKRDINILLNRFSRNHIETIKAYLLHNCDANNAANSLYLHRNSYAYRLKKIVYETDLEYNDINSLMFIKLCLLQQR